MTTSAASKPKAQADELVDLALARYELGRSPGGEAFGVPVDGPALATMLRGGDRSVRAELAAAYHDVSGKAPSSNALAAALQVLEGRAQRCGPRDLALRVGRHGGAVVVDLGDESGRAVEISPSGWQVVDRSPVLFRRTRLTAPLPVPDESGTLDELLDHVHVDPADWPLLAAWLVAALDPDHACPALALVGEQGTAKSTTARRLVDIVDPSRAPLRDRPPDGGEWAVTAAASRVVALDNLSSLPIWLSDALCRAVTGDGFARRQLYTDGDLIVVNIRRALILTTIDLGEVRGDLADRCLILELAPLLGTERRSDEQLDATFAAAHARLVGGLFTLVSAVLTTMPNVRLGELPRMADYARTLAAVDHILGTSAAARYLQRSIDNSQDLIDGDPFASAVRDLAEARGEWVGTARSLLDLLPRPDPTPRRWPADPTRAGGALRRIAPMLRRVGINVDLRRDGNTRTVHLSVTTDPASVTTDASASPGDPDQTENSDAADANDATATPLFTGHIKQEEGREREEQRTSVTSVTSVTSDAPAAMTASTVAEHLPPDAGELVACTTCGVSIPATGERWPQCAPCAEPF